MVDKHSSDEEDQAMTSQARLTKHVGLIREFPPLYTGGSFVLLKNDKLCLSLRNGKICLFELENTKLISEFSWENEEIICFAVSPNQ
jgi:hypothetical protein